MNTYVITYTLNDGSLHRIKIKAESEESAYKWFRDNPPKELKQGLNTAEDS